MLGVLGRRLLPRHGTACGAPLARTRQCSAYIDFLNKERKKWQHGKRKGKPVLPKQPTHKPMPNFALADVFAANLQRFQQYTQDFGLTVVPPGFQDDPELAEWAMYCRKTFGHNLSKAQVQALKDCGFPFSIDQATPRPAGTYQNELRWVLLFHELRHWHALHHHFAVPRTPHKHLLKSGRLSPGFFEWFHHQRVLFVNHELPPHRVVALGKLGYDLFTVCGLPNTPEQLGAYERQHVATSATEPDAHFQKMLTRLAEWKKRFGGTEVFDDPVLGEWVSHVRAQYRHNKLAQWQVERLEELGLRWRVPTPEASYFSSAHEARRYFVENSRAIPLDYHGNQPTWQIAAKWMARQLTLLRKGKLGVQKLAAFTAAGGMEHVKQDPSLKKLLTQARRLAQRASQATPANKAPSPRTRRVSDMEADLLRAGNDKLSTEERLAMHLESMKRMRAVAVKKVAQEGSQQRKFKNRKADIVKLEVAPSLRRVPRERDDLRALDIA